MVIFFIRNEFLHLIKWQSCYITYKKINNLTSWIRFSTYRKKILMLFLNSFYRALIKLNKNLKSAGLRFWNEGEQPLRNPHRHPPQFRGRGFPRFHGRESRTGAAEREAAEDVADEQGVVGEERGVGNGAEVSRDGRQVCHVRPVLLQLLLCELKWIKFKNFKKLTCSSIPW